MNLDWYYTFIVMSKTLNYRKAKELIHLSEPSIHKQIKNLEKYLNIKLFKNNGNKLFLTEEGAEFVYYAKKIIREHENGTNIIRSFKKNKNDCLNILISYDVSSSLANDFLLYFFKMKPSNIDISININNKNTKESNFDIYICQNYQYIKNFNTKKIYDRETMLFVPDNKENEILNREDEFLKKYPILLNNNFDYSEEVKKIINNLDPQSSFINVNDSNVIENFIRSNQGISYLPSFFKYKRGLKAINPKLINPPKYTLYLLTNNKKRELIKKFKSIGKKFLINYIVNSNN